MCWSPGIELDLFAPKDEDRPHLFKLFYVLFRRDAFLPAADTNVTFHELALDQGRRWQALVSNKLTEVVFDHVFPELVNALYANDRERPAGKPDRVYLDECAKPPLTILYRLLFVLYAEDRGLLPVDDDRYDDYSLRRISRHGSQQRGTPAMPSASGVRLSTGTSKSFGH